MGTDFRNEFSWSTSRDRLFSRCLRAYWWRYYAHWGGWGWDAPTEARVAYRLGKLDTLETWAGSIVHDVIEEAIGALRQDGTAIEAEALRREGRRRLRIGWKQSRDGDWVRSPKRNVLLWAHYYGSEEDRSAERTKFIADRVYTALDGFAAGPWPARLAALAPEAWRNVEMLDSIQIDGRTVYVKPDLAFEEDGLLWLVDWKTGRPGSADGFQLATYALYARDKWGVEPAQARAVLSYLAYAKEETVPLNEAALDDAFARVRTSMAAMLDLLDDVDENAGSRESFPTAEDASACRRCSFRQLCYGVEGVAGAKIAKDPASPGAGGPERP